MKGIKKYIKTALISRKTQDYKAENKGYAVEN